MLGLVKPFGMILYRRVAGRAVRWRRIDGGLDEILLALVASRKLHQLVGGDRAEELKKDVTPEVTPT